MKSALFLFKYFGLLLVAAVTALFIREGAEQAVMVLAAWLFILPFAPTSSSTFFHRLFYAQVFLFTGFLGGMAVIYTANYRVPPDPDRTLGELLGWICLLVALWASYEFVTGPDHTEENVTNDPTATE